MVSHHINHMEKLMNRTETTLYAIGNASLACAVLFVCWGSEGWVFNAGILYAGMMFGSLITEALNYKGE
jgi:hypothetical protein